MEALQHLRRDHRQIERVLAAMKKGAARARAGGPLDVEAFAVAQGFLRRYEEGLHHEKEDVLFAALRRGGLPSGAGPVAKIFGEHIQHRELREKMASATERLRGGEAAAGEELLALVEDFVTKMEAHVAEEDEFLYPFAQRTVPVRLLEKLPAAYAQLDHEYGESITDAATAVERAFGLEPS